MHPIARSTSMFENASAVDSDKTRRRRRRKLVIFTDELVGSRVNSDTYVVQYRVSIPGPHALVKKNIIVVGFIRL